ncbi:ribosome biogenesis GTPase Der [Kaistia algarum]|uniref:ribosome biogenesis GTPase Der n=1 Tax=Kaistia algarum TaxID=2083279 RepID=UPI000CE74AEC|nr:ribosome biogenesis GTPase Der [Kaistia algarum]MCX5512001.1 ribosome biogenesis GTPase Der [Kaistia algarum]PPE80129.1 ribosome biogenesis GTPase Der [Kaistia algarum]
MSFTAAIIGRPNVGKSTLFNRLVGSKIALVDDTPGVTRDRRPGEAKIGDLYFTIIDTAGLEEADPASLEGRMQMQTDAAIAEADVALFVIDARAGITPVDEHFAEVLRRVGKPVVLIANKAEGKVGEAGVFEAYSLGFGEPVAISAEHGEGMADLFAALLPFERIEPETEEEEAAESAEIVFSDDDEAEVPIDPTKPIRVAVVGRPNAGKSTLINTMLGEERLLTGPEAGITRDSISVDWVWRDRSIKLFDTAGMRKKARVETKLEKLSVGDTLRAIRFAEVVVLMLDATMPFEKQDLQIADLVAREGRALVIALNKWDLIEDRQKTMAAIREMAERLLPQVRGVPLVPLSGLTGSGIDKLMAELLRVYGLWNRRVPTAAINRWLAATLEHHPPPAVSGRRVKLRYMTQPKARPPTFVAFCSRPEALPESYTRYLLNGLREAFDLQAVPLRLTLRKGENPYENKAKKR